jgi:hypothetical protein
MVLYPLIASLILAERTHRQARSISYRIAGAKFPVLKDIDKFVFADTPVDEGQVRELTSGAFLDAKRNAIFIGGTGTGKTHLCIAVASAVIRARRQRAFLQSRRPRQSARTGKGARAIARNTGRRVGLEPAAPVRSLSRSRGRPRRPLASALTH